MLALALAAKHHCNQLGMPINNINDLSLELHLNQSQQLPKPGMQQNDTITTGSSNCPCCQ
jgi:hypothetical protein